MLLEMRMMRFTACDMGISRSGGLARAASSTMTVSNRTSWPTLSPRSKLISPSAAFWIVAASANVYDCRASRVSSGLFFRFRYRSRMIFSISSVLELCSLAIISEQRLYKSHNSSSVSSELPSGTVTNCDSNSSFSSFSFGRNSSGFPGSQSAARPSRVRCSSVNRRAKGEIAKSYARSAPSSAKLSSSVRSALTRG